MGKLDALFSSKDEAWRTPQYVFDYYNKIYQFNFDLACSEHNKLCENGFTKEQDSLKQDWYAKDRVAWLNPPYSADMREWFAKAVEESNKGMTICMLVYARTDTRWWHDYVLPNAYSIRFIKSRIKFLDSSTGKERGSSTAPSCLIVFSPEKKLFLPYIQDHFPIVKSDSLKEMKELRK